MKKNISFTIESSYINYNYKINEKEYN